jgi:multiple sugar transport system substrate-binding protein
VPADPSKTTISIPQEEEIFSSKDSTSRPEEPPLESTPSSITPPFPTSTSPPQETTPTQEIPPSIGPPAPPQEIFFKDQSSSGGLKNLFLKLLIPLAIIIIVILVFKLLTAFVSRIKSPSPESKKEAKATLTYWGLWEPEEVIQPLVQEYQSSHPGITINYQKQNHQQYRQSLQYALEKEGAPDIFRLHNSWLPMFKNNLAPMPEDVKKTLSPDNIFYPIHKSELSINGQYYALPLEIDGLGLFINNEIFQNAGKSPPTTWDELRQTAIDLTVKDEAEKIKIAGVALGTPANIDHWSDILAIMMLQNGVDFKNITQNSDLAEGALNYFTLFTRIHKIWDETLPHSTAAFATGKLAMYFGPSWEAIDIHALNPDLDFRIIPIPQLPDPNSSSGKTNLTWASYWVEGVNKNSKNIKQAWEFLTFLSQKQTLEKLFENAKNSGRLFGEPYPRSDMVPLLESDKYLGAYIRQAPSSQSWFLCSRTWDEGINDKMIEYFATAVNAVNQGKTPKKAIQDLNQGINQVLSQYGLITSSAQPQ